MPSSKYPKEFIPVSDALVAFAVNCPGVALNLRPAQRLGWKRPTGDPFDPADDFVASPLKDLLRQVIPGDHLVMHFQGLTQRGVGTAVVAVTNICWGDGAQRLDFLRPAGFGEIYGRCPNFWSPFILAAARVVKASELETRWDLRAQFFQRVVRNLGQSPGPVLVEV